MAEAANPGELAEVAFAATLWVALLGAVALCSLVLSVVGVFTIGALVFLFACLELGAAIAMRWRATALGWIACILTAVVVWTLVVPAQIAGLRWLPWIPAFPLAGVLGTLAMRATPPTALGPRP
jgi:cytochrome bd-type quinol oxidase subunit 2